MLNREKLIKAITDDLAVCKKANPTDQVGAERRNLELATLVRHLDWTQKAGDDQAELERIVKSLEDRQAKTVLRGYQHWRERATA